MEIHIDKGRGYVPADKNKQPDQPIGVIPVDSIYSPITRVKFAVNDSIIEGGADMCYTVDYVFANFFLVANNFLASHWFIPPSLIISSCLQ